MRLPHFCALSLCLGFASCASRQNPAPIARATPAGANVPAVSDATATNPPTTAPVAATLPYSPQSLKIVDFDPGPVGVGYPLTGWMLIRNTGPAYHYPVYTVRKDGTPISGHRVEGVYSPIYEVTIYDSKDELLFKTMGAWGSGMKKDDEFKIHWNTEHNHTEEASDGRFVIHSPGTYRISVAVFSGEKPAKQLDSFTTHFEVPPRPTKPAK